uniref:hypothetical protein n=1 Tax=Acetatifactor sp. TaxID=1872090 RepID=UPI004057BD58
MKKRKGTISTVVALFYVIFLVVIIAYMTQIYTYQTIKIDTEDALAASNLASAVIDIQEYGISQNIIIKDPVAAFGIYKDALKVNMGLNDSWYSTGQRGITGPVLVLEYVIYNVRDNDVEIHYFGSSNYSQVIPGGKGTVTAPNGKLIESTSVYSKITFSVEGIFDIQTTAVKEKLVDIVS